MNVKNEINYVEKLREIINAQKGILFTSDLQEHGIPRTYLAILEKNGEIERVSRGIYSAVNAIVDEMFSLQVRYKSAIFSHETAMFLLELTDRTPLFYSVTVPSGYNASSLKASGAKVYFVHQALYSLGLISVKSPHGNAIQTYNLERTLCDVLRSKNRMDIQLVNEALKRYVGKKERNIDVLYEYARQFRIQEVVREYIEVLL